jgi:hypothetical protein
VNKIRKSSVFWGAPEALLLEIHIPLELFSQTLMRHRNWRVWLKMQHGLTVKPAICSYMLSGRCSCVAMPRRRSKKTYSARAQKYQTNLENRNRARDKVKMERSVDVGPSGSWLRKVGTHGENASHIEEGQ